MAKAGTPPWRTGLGSTRGTVIYLRLVMGITSTATTRGLLGLDSWWTPCRYFNEFVRQSWLF